MTKRATGKSPFELVYGTKVKLPINLKIHVYHLLQQFTTNQEVVQARSNQLVELDESKRIAFNQMIQNKERFKGTFLSKGSSNNFCRGRYCTHLG
jgi:hypothetical protein